MRYCLLLSLMCSLLAFGQDKEFRGVWVDAFHPGIKSRAEIEQLLDTVRKNNFNAVVAQVRKRSDAYYNSHFENKGADINPDFDPLGELIKQAHGKKPYIAVYAWFNTCAVATYNISGSLAEAHPEWLSLTSDGTSWDGEAYKIDPGHPSAVDWTARTAVDLTRRYDIDGLQLDFTRYGGMNWGYNPTNLQRYRESNDLPNNFTPQPEDTQWMNWRTRQVTNLVQRISADVHSVKPKVVVSATTVCWGQDPAYIMKPGNPPVFQNWNEWLKLNLIDAHFPMTYFDNTVNSTAYEQWLKFLGKAKHGKPQVLGLGIWLNTPKDTKKQISEAKSSGNNKPNGYCFYSYAVPQKQNTNTNYVNDPWSYFAKDVFGNRKASFEFQSVTQKNGILIGGIYRTDKLLPVEKARVTLSQNGKTIGVSTIDGNGRFAIMGVNPGKVQVLFDINGKTVTAETEIRAGKASWVVLNTETSGIKIVNRFSELSLLNNNAKVIFPKLFVTENSVIGSNRIYVVDKLNTKPISVELSEPLTMPLLKGDVITLSGYNSKGELTVITKALYKVIGAVLLAE